MHHRASRQEGGLFIDPDSPFQRVSSPEEAVERLTDLHATATSALRDALERYFATGIAPDAAERARFATRNSA